MQKYIPALVLVLIAGVASSAFGRGNREVRLVNVLAFDSTFLHHVRLDYDASDIRLEIGEGDEIMVEEYMNVDGKAYYARTRIEDGELLVTEGRRPRWKGFVSRIVLAVPSSYASSLSLHTTSGSIVVDEMVEDPRDLHVDTTSGSISLSNLRTPEVAIATTNGDVTVRDIDVSRLDFVATNGTFRLEDSEVGKVQIETTNADVAIENVIGTFDYQTKGGRLRAVGMVGDGLFTATGDGTIVLGFASLSSEISASVRNGDLEVSLPADASCLLAATTREGRIEAPFPDLVVSPAKVTGTIGAEGPHATLTLESRNGDIRVR